MKFNEWTKGLIYKNVSLILFLQRGPPFVVSLRGRSRDIYFQRGHLSDPIPSSESQGVPTLVPSCKPYRQRRPNASDRQGVPSSTFDSLSLSKSDRVLITWSPSGYTPVGQDCSDAQPSPCLLITTWQLVKAHGVTRERTEKSMSYVILHYIVTY